MITLELSKCSGCSRCQVNCSFFHTQRICRGEARIKVVKIEDIGIDFPVVCQQCEERYCTKCPEKAITVGKLGQVEIAADLCTACGTCEIMCPIGAIEMFEESPVVCDLCGGTPQCVEACNLDAIHFDPALSEAVSLKTFKKGSRDLSPEQKRLRYAQELSKELRQQWVSERRS